MSSGLFCGPGYDTQGTSDEPGDDIMRYILWACTPPLIHHNPPQNQHKSLHSFGILPILRIEYFAGFKRQKKLYAWMEGTMKSKYRFHFFLGILGIILTVFCLNAAPNPGETPRKAKVYLIEEVSFTQAGVSPVDLWQTAKKTLSELDYPLTGETRGDGKEAVLLSRIMHHTILKSMSRSSSPSPSTNRFPASIKKYYLIITQKPETKTLNIKIATTGGETADWIGRGILKKYVSALKANFQ